MSERTVTTGADENQSSALKICDAVGKENAYQKTFLFSKRFWTSALLCGIVCVAKKQGGKTMAMLTIKEIYYGDKYSSFALRQLNVSSKSRS